MPVTIIEVGDHSVRLMQVYHHNCSLGEFQGQLTQKIMDIFTARAKEKKERVNWHDLFQAALRELESKGIISCDVPWQKLENGTLFPSGFTKAVQTYNNDPKSFDLIRMVLKKSETEKLDE